MTENNAAQPGLTDAIAVLKGLRSSLATHRANGPSMLCTDSRALNDADDDVLRALKILVPLSKLRADGVQASDEREAFEAAVQAEYGVSAPSLLLRDADGDYVTMNTEWVFWLRRAALASAPVADSTLPLEQALHELVNKIDSGLDTGDLLQDARRASTALDAIMASAPVAGEALTAEDVERQYRDGVHIGSGLHRATCPCGFCSKHRHGFERGDDLAAPQASQKPHEVADLVNRLRDIAVKHHGSQQLRERIAHEIRPLFAPQASEAVRPALAVWYGSMPESNGRKNWTAILYRKGEVIFDGPHITIDRSEYPDRVRYEADRVRYLIGEIDEEPWILDYDADKCDAPPQADKDGGDCAKGAGDVDKLRAALILARDSHRVVLLSDPPQDAWKARRVDEVIRAALAAQPGEQRNDPWQPIETAPKDQVILLFAGLKKDGKVYAPHVNVGYWTEQFGWTCLVYSHQEFAHIEPTHWMPRPDFPQHPSADGGGRG